MSVPVYSSNKKNWFHIQPRLERRSGTPLASCPVSPVEPLRPPVVLRRALRPYPGELRWATAHSTTRTQSFLRSMATPTPSNTEGRLSSSRRSALSPEVFFVSFSFFLLVRVSDQPSCCKLLSRGNGSLCSHGPAKQHLEHLHRKKTKQTRMSILGGEAAICSCSCTDSCFVSKTAVETDSAEFTAVFEDAALLALSQEMASVRTKATTNT